MSPLSPKFSVHFRRSVVGIISKMFRTRLYLSLECLVLFGLLPVGLWILSVRGGFPFFPVLFLFLAITLILGAFDPRVRFRPQPPGRPVPRLWPRMVLAAVALVALTAWIDAELLFRLPRKQPRIWVLVMLLYPLLSVAPQEYLYRTFFLQRYQPVFGDGTCMLVVNAVLFGWAHIFFVNWIAPVLSGLGGLWIAHTWMRTRCFRRVCLEHALYGQLVFTSGIGWFFYTGSVQALEHLPTP